MKQLVKQTVVGRFASDHCFKDVRVADFLDPPHCSLFFQTIDDCLHSCVGRTLLFGKVFLNLTHRTTPKRPHRAHYFQLQTRQPYLLFFDHPAPLLRMRLKLLQLWLSCQRGKRGMGKTETWKQGEEVEGKGKE